MSAPEGAPGSQPQPAAVTPPPPQQQQTEVQQQQQSAPSAALQQPPQQPMSQPQLQSQPPQQSVPQQQQLQQANQQQLPQQQVQQQAPPQQPQQQPLQPATQQQQQQQQPQPQPQQSAQQQPQQTQPQPQQPPSPVPSHASASADVSAPAAPPPPLASASSVPQSVAQGSVPPSGAEPAVSIATAPAVPNPTAAAVAASPQPPAASDAGSNVGEEWRGSNATTPPGVGGGSTAAVSSVSAPAAPEGQQSGVSTGAIGENKGKRRSYRLKDHETFGEDGSGSSSESDDDEPQKRQGVACDNEEKVVERSPLGRFMRFNKKLGSGAHKTVYLCFDNETGKEVAWNVIPLRDMDKRAKTRIASEINMLKSLKHPRVIAFINAWFDKPNNQVCFITERVTGGSLLQYIRRIGAPLKKKVMRTWSRQILEGLTYLHNREEPIIHRDLKCDNIFVNSNVGEVLIGDLGLSTTLKQSCATSIVGTPDFIAPEIYEEKYGTAVDIYAFGMCLLEMLVVGEGATGSPYEECQTPGQVYRKVIAGIKPRAVRRIKDPGLRSIVDSCIDKDPSLRPNAPDLLAIAWLQDNDTDGHELCSLIPMSELPPEEPQPPGAQLAEAARQEPEIFIEHATKHMTQIAEEGEEGDASHRPMSSAVQPGMHSTASATGGGQQNPGEPTLVRTGSASSVQMQEPQLQAPQTGQQLPEQPRQVPMQQQQPSQSPPQLQPALAGLPGLHPTVSTPLVDEPQPPIHAASGSAPYSDPIVTPLGVPHAVSAPSFLVDEFSTPLVSPAPTPVHSEQPLRATDVQDIPQSSGGYPTLSDPALEPAPAIGIHSSPAILDPMPQSASPPPLLPDMSTNDPAFAAFDPAAVAAQYPGQSPTINVGSNTGITATVEPLASGERGSQPTTGAQGAGGVGGGGGGGAFSSAGMTLQRTPSPPPGPPQSSNGTRVITDADGPLPVEEVERAIRALNGKTITQVEMSVKRDAYKYNVAFDFDPRVDQPMQIAWELKEAAIAPTQTPMEELIHDIERAIVNRCRALTVPALEVPEVSSAAASVATAPTTQEDAKEEQKRLLREEGIRKMQQALEERKQKQNRESALQMEALMGKSFGSLERKAQKANEAQQSQLTPQLPTTEQPHQPSGKQSWAPSPAPMQGLQQGTSATAAVGQHATPVWTTSGALGPSTSHHNLSVPSSVTPVPAAPVVSDPATTSAGPGPSGLSPTAPGLPTSSSATGLSQQVPAEGSEAPRWQSQTTPPHTAAANSNNNSSATWSSHAPPPYVGMAYPSAGMTMPGAPTGSVGGSSEVPHSNQAPWTGPSHPQQNQAAWSPAPANPADLSRSPESRGPSKDSDSLLL